MDRVSRRFSAMGRGGGVVPPTAIPHLEQNPSSGWSWRPQLVQNISSPRYQPTIRRPGDQSSPRETKPVSRRGAEPAESPHKVKLSLRFSLRPLRLCEKSFFVLPQVEQ